MTEVLTAGQMRAIEEAAMAAGRVTGIELMERAGAGVVAAMLDWSPALAEGARRAVVLCGPGNNGGDGFVIARLLRERGWGIDLYLYGDPDRLPPDAMANMLRWRTLGSVHPLEGQLALPEAPAVTVDALFGGGLSRPLSGDLREAVVNGLFREIDPGLIVAVDAPSGLCLDSGRVLGAEVVHRPEADLTVTFQWPRIGHYLADGPDCCGALRVVDIGLGAAAGPAAALARLAEDAPEARAALGKGAGAHKYDHGHALVLAGGVGRGGAARLAARGALRVGAGLVTLGCPAGALIENACRLDAVMLAPVADVEALEAEIAARKLRAVCIGPGFGFGERLEAFVAALLARGADAGPAVVLDADALSAYRDDPDALFARTHAGCVLTPHEGEFGRLFPDLLARLDAPAAAGPAYSKLDAAREAAARAGCTVLFKGADTVVAAPDGRAVIAAAAYETAAPWLATAGSGDVLAGFITGLLARGLAPLDAAATGAWLHAAAARRFGPGLIAEDLPDALPGVFRDLGL